MTYKLLKKVIESGRYDKLDVQKKLDVFLAFGRITKEEYEELSMLLNPVTA
ncbi:MAG: DUF1974 domain-containing protein [Anaerotruncus sp.]|jgi:hypothetical protein|nr:DUF1974 domain-containing protein [Anaerotruncus sp.]